jgi:hypothetical protein
MLRDRRDTGLLDLHLDSAAVPFSLARIAMFAFVDAWMNMDLYRGAANTAELSALMHGVEALPQP